MLHIINKRMPSEAIPFFWIKVFSTFGYAVLYSSLVLYIQNSLGGSAVLATGITGVFIAFNFLLHLFGGYIGGRFLSYRMLFIIGIALEFIGSVCLVFSTMYSLYIGLSIFLTGCGVYVSSLNCIMTFKFRANEPTKREAAFLWVYSGMNIGFFSAMIIAGYFHLTNSYQSLFFISALTSLVSLILFSKQWQHMVDVETIYSKKNIIQQRKSFVSSFIVIMSIIPLLLLMFKYPSFSGNLVLVSGLLMIATAIYIATRQTERESRNKLMAFTVLLVSGIAFWALFYISPMGLTLFIKYHVNQSVAGISFPPQWFGNVNTLVVVFGGPLLAYVFSKMREQGMKVSIPSQFTFAMLFMAAAFLILPLGVYFSDDKLASGWVISCYALQAIGELCLSPIGYAMIGQLVPNRLQGVMMGMWMMTSGVASGISRSLSLSMLGSTSEPIPPMGAFTHSFNLLGVSMIGAAILLMIFTPKLNKLIGLLPSKSHKKMQSVAG